MEFSYVYFDSYVEKSNFNTFVDEIKGKAESLVEDAVEDLRENISKAFNNLLGKKVSEDSNQSKELDINKMQTRREW